MTSKTGLLHHIEIYVSNLEKSIEFWRSLLETLNYQKFQEWKGGMSWKLQDHYIVLVQTKKEDLTIPYNRLGVGINHLAFHIDSKEMIDSIAENLIKNGTELLYDDKYRKNLTQDPYSIFFEDPDKIKIELVYEEP